MAVLKKHLSLKHSLRLVLSAPNGLNGLDIAYKEEPDEILLDIIMSGMDGYEVCRKLKANKTNIFS